MIAESSATMSIRPPFRTSRCRELSRSWIRIAGNLVVIKRLPNGGPEFAVYADGAPRYGSGEGSIEVGQRLGLKSDPRYGGTSERQIVFVVLSDRMAFPANADEVKRSANAAFEKWGGEARLEACRQALLSAPR
jgi:hypothetical protein